MDASRIVPDRPATGMRRLLGHCAALGRATSDGSAPARSRLESELGAELTTRLVGALARRPRALWL